MIDAPAAIASERPGAVVPPAKLIRTGFEQPKSIDKAEGKHRLAQGLPFCRRRHNVRFFARWIVNIAIFQGDIEIAADMDLAFAIAQDRQVLLQADRKSVV